VWWCRYYVQGCSFGYITCTRVLVAEHNWQALVWCLVALGRLLPALVTLFESLVVFRMRQGCTEMHDSFGGGGLHSGSTSSGQGSVCRSESLMQHTPTQVHQVDSIHCCRRLLLAAAAAAVIGPCYCTPHVRRCHRQCRPTSRQAAKAAGCSIQRDTHAYTAVAEYGGPRGGG
jgi:hypothetical protein